MAQKKISFSLITSFFVAGIFLFSTTARAATISVLPNSATTKVGGSVTISVVVDAQGQAINTISGQVEIPDALKLQSVSTNGSVLDTFIDPVLIEKPIHFTGVRLLSSGFAGKNGFVLSFTVRADVPGTYPIKITQVSVLAADGSGTEVLKQINTGVISVGDTAMTDPIKPLPETSTVGEISLVDRLHAPIITNFSSTIDQSQSVYIRGLASPDAQVKLGVKSLSVNSLGDRVLNFFREKKVGLDSVYVQADDGGVFEYISPAYLLAGVYGVTPYEKVTEDTTIAGSTVHVTVNQQTVIGMLVFLINALALVVPLILLVLIISFIPWYGKKVMHFLSLWIARKEKKLEDPSNK